MVFAPNMFSFRHKKYLVKSRKRPCLRLQNYVTLQTSCDVMSGLTNKKAIYPPPVLCGLSPSLYNINSWVSHTAMDKFTLKSLEKAGVLLSDTNRYVLSQYELPVYAVHECVHLGG